MIDVAFVFTNPRHHLEMMLPVARELQRRGKRCRFVSLAEVRGLETPASLGADPSGVPPIQLRRALPLNIRRNPRVGASIGHPRGNHGWIRTVLQRVITTPLLPVARRLIGGAPVVVVPNDAAFPYRELIASIPGREIVLLQEGIRFEFPGGDPYGTCGATTVCAWGEASAELFVSRGVRRDAIVVTGAPRLDAMDLGAWRARGTELRARLGLRTAPLAYLSNPIETQGFATEVEKLALFERFLSDAKPTLAARAMTVLVKPHPNEDVAAYAAIGRRVLEDRCIVTADTPVQAAICASAAAVVLASTVGIDALMLGARLGALEIPNHGFGFEYVKHGAAVGIRLGSIAGDLEMLLASYADPEKARTFVERHLKDRGHAATNVADVISSRG